MKRLFLIAIALLLGACASSARLYNLDTGEILSATYENYGTGRGRITLRTPSGATLSGEYTTISGAGMSWGAGSASGSFGWATAQGFSFHQPGQQFGSATVVGGGMVIDLVYAVDPWTGRGQGVGRDNRGGRYRVHF
jgi:hypothetical protein